MIVCTEGCAASKQQCGGLGWVGAQKCCTRGEKCVVKDPGFYQCIRPREVPDAWDGTVQQCGTRSNHRNFWVV